MKRVLVFLLWFLLFASGSLAGIYIYEPKDQLITFDKIVMLRGLGAEVGNLKINNQPLKFGPDGSFSCGLLVKRGKNYVEIRAREKNQNQFVKEVRILGLKTFPDIEILYEGKKHWARNQIVYLSSLDFIEGYPEDNFYPGNPITRGELATWIARVKNLKIPTLSEDVFFDVPKEHWRAPYIKAVADAGFMSGYATQTFGIDDPVSRRQVAGIVLATEGIETVEKVKSFFIDVPQEEKGALPIYIAREKGFVIGVYEDIPVYEPDRALTRAEAAMLLSRFSRSLDAVQSLFNFEKGYSQENFCDLNIPPEIVAFTVDPGKLEVKKKSVVRLRAQIASREGFSPISRVKVDLAEIGGMPDVEMFDDGTHGDEEKNNLIYSLNISIEPEETGNKTLTVTAIDRWGWENKKEASLLLLK